MHSRDELFGQRVRPAERVVTRRLTGQLVLLHLDTEQYFGLNEVGTSMWQALCEESTVEVAYERLLGGFDADPRELRQDLEHLLADLVDHGLVEIGNG